MNNDDDDDDDKKSHFYEFIDAVQMQQKQFTLTKNNIYSLY